MLILSQRVFVSNRLSSFGADISRGQSRPGRVIAPVPARPRPLVVGRLAPVRQVETKPKLKAIFLMGVGLVFLMFSMLHQIQTYLMGVNLYFLYIVGIPAVFGLVFSGGVKRAFERSPVFYWCAFFVWMTLAIPFSYWKGGSFGLVETYVRTVLPTMFIIAGVTRNWRDFKFLMATIAAAAVVNVFSARLFSGDDQFGGRAGLELGTVSNPNDYAAHLLLVLAFLLWFILVSKSFVLRLCASAVFAFGVYLIVASASRGAVLALVGGTLLFFLLGTKRQRIALGLLAPIAVGALLISVPESALQRVRSYSSSDESASAEALESSAIREYLLKTSLEYIVQHPLFGIGPGQFKTYEGTTNKLVGDHGEWKDTHNSYTQATSEAGLPAGLFFLAGIISTFKIFHSTWRKARARPDCRDIEVAAACLIVGYGAFCMALTFVNFAYFFYMPAMAGFAVALSRCAGQEFQTRNGSSAR